MSSPVMGAYFEELDTYTSTQRDVLRPTYYALMEKFTP